MKRLEQSFNRVIFIEMIFSILYALLGLFIFLKSEMTNSVVGMLIGVFFLVSGFITIYTAIDKNKFKLFRFNTIFGILSIVMGILIMLNPLSIINILNISLGIWLLINGINKFIYFILLKKIGEESNKIFLVSALLFVILGILIIINPFINLVITKTIGIFIVLYNILNLNDLVLLKRREKFFLKLFK